MPVAKEQIRQIISENNLNSVADVYALLRDGFKDILQELMETEMDATLGYKKNRNGDLQTDNRRNGHSPKTSRASMGCCAGRDSRRLQRNPRHYRRGKRNRQVLAEDAERPA